MATLILANNSITGEVPVAISELSSLEHLQIEYNDFEYHSTGPTAALLYRCRRLLNGIDCAGLPPHSCHAFGDKYRVRTDEPGQCIRCFSALYSVIALSSLLAIFR